MAEIKHVYQDVKVLPEDASQGIFKVQNRFYFKSLNEYALRWAVTADGTRIASGNVALSAAPQSEYSLASGNIFTVRYTLLEGGILSVESDFKGCQVLKNRSMCRA